MDENDTSRIGCSEQLAALLLPYLEPGDEKAINDLADRLKHFGISLNVVTASETYASSTLMFTKESSRGERTTSVPETESMDFWSAPQLGPVGFMETAILDQPEIPDMAALAQDFLGDMPMNGNTNPGRNICDDELMQAGFNVDILGDIFAHSAQQTSNLSVQLTSDPEFEEHGLITTGGHFLDVQNHCNTEARVQSFATSPRPVLADVEGEMNGHQDSSTVRSDEPRRISTRVAKRSCRTRIPSNKLIRWESYPITTLFPNDIAPSNLTGLRSMYGPGTKYDLSDKMLQETVDISKQFIRPDLVSFLQEALPRWKKEGFWGPEQMSEPAAGGPGRTMLIEAYTCICKLENRMRDDQIRNRVAVVMLHMAYEQACFEWRRPGSQPRHSKGRGDASRVIDEILEARHDDWHQAERKRQLRSRFHDKKRFGKRWLSLARVLGMGIFLVCSSRVASVVHTTFYKAGVLEALAYCIDRIDPKNLETLRLLNATAASLLHAGHCDDIEPDRILQDIRSLH